jgi:hypothetical protein
VGHLKTFKFCPQCKCARYCGDGTGLDHGWARADVRHIRKHFEEKYVFAPAQAEDVSRIGYDEGGNPRGEAATCAKMRFDSGTVWGSSGVRSFSKTQH